MKFLNNLYKRIVLNWQTTLVGILLFIGYRWYNHGKIDFADFKEYITLIATIVLLLMKDWKKGEENS